MQENNFIWVDLSSYNPNKTKEFYKAVFKWDYYDSYGYQTAYKNTKEVAGLYETPDKFKTMNMPSFWMSYIQVNSVIETVEKAKSLGAIIELVDLNNSIGSIALIRDTSGAGFTVYEGNKLNSKTKNEANTFIFNELHVSDARKAILFYKNLFQWNFKKIYEDSYEVYDIQEEHIATINKIDNSVKGKYEYWTVIFAVENLKDTLNKIEVNGGSLIFDEGDRLLCSDGSEAFFYIQKI